MIVRACCCLLLLASITDARVDFNHSRIYDEYDFKGKSSVNVDSLCKSSCRIFASITPESKKLAANILIQLPKGFISIADVAAKIDPATNLKSYVEVSNVPSLAIVNGNPRYGAGPLVLYVVRMSMGSSEVYEADGLLRPASKSIPDSITVMSAAPFTLKQAPLDGPQGVHAVMGGFDALDGEPCPDLYYARYDPFPAFTMEVNGPIITIRYDYNEYSTPPAEISATIGITNKRQLERSGWVGSPGYHGCQGKEVYRSSLYDTVSLIHAEVTNSEPEHILVDVNTNSHADHSVILTDEDNDKRFSVSQTGNVPYLYTFNTKNLTINWMPEGTTGDSHFLVRWNSTIAP